MLYFLDPYLKQFPRAKEIVNVLPVTPEHCYTYKSTTLWCTTTTSTTTTTTTTTAITITIIIIIIIIIIITFHVICCGMAEVLLNYYRFELRKTSVRKVVGSIPDGLLRFFIDSILPVAL